MEILARAPVGLLPVLIFLVILVWMDSYKLVSLKAVLAVIVLGGLTAFACKLSAKLRMLIRSGSLLQAGDHRTDVSLQQG